MAVRTVDQALPAGSKLKRYRSIIGIVLALFVLVLFQSLRFPPTLTPVGHSLLTVLLSMLVLWVTEAVSYAASSFFLIGAMTLLVAYSPNVQAGGQLVGTKEALGMALSGFASDAWILVACALFLAAAIEKTNLGHRIGLLVLKMVGVKPRRMLLGILAMAFVLCVFIPAQAANAALMTAVAMGMVQAFGLDRKSNLAKAMLLLVGFGTGIAGMGILTSGAPPVQTANFIAQATKHDIKWLEWFAYGMPFAVVVGLVLYFLVLLLFPVENRELEGGASLSTGSWKPWARCPAVS